jgi:hypothetical protein
VYASKRPERANVGSDEREVEGRSASVGWRGSRLVGWKKRREGIGCDIAYSSARTRLESICLPLLQLYRTH